MGGDKWVCSGGRWEWGRVEPLVPKPNHVVQIHPGGHAALAAGVDDAG